MKRRSANLAKRSCICIILPLTAALCNKGTMILWIEALLPGGATFRRTASSVPVSACEYVLAVTFKAYFEEQ